MQDKVIKDLCKVIEGQGFEPVVMMGYSNTGRISVQEPNEIGELASIGFNFQNGAGTMNFNITVQMHQIPSQPGRKDYFDFYINYTDRASYKRFRFVVEHELMHLNHMLHPRSSK